MDARLLWKLGLQFSTHLIAFPATENAPKKVDLACLISSPMTPDSKSWKSHNDSIEINGKILHRAEAVDSENKHCKKVVRQ